MTKNKQNNDKVTCAKLLEEYFLYPQYLIKEKREKRKKKKNDVTVLSNVQYIEYEF